MKDDGATTPVPGCGCPKCQSKHNETEVESPLGRPMRRTVAFYALHKRIRDVVDRMDEGEDRNELTQILVDAIVGDRKLTADDVAWAKEAVEDLSKQTKDGGQHV